MVGPDVFERIDVELALMWRDRAAINIAAQAKLIATMRRKTFHFRLLLRARLLLLRQCPFEGSLWRDPRTGGILPIDERIGLFAAFRPCINRLPINAGVCAEEDIAARARSTR